MDRSDDHLRHVFALGLLVVVLVLVASACRASVPPIADENASLTEARSTSPAIEPTAEPPPATPVPPTPVPTVTPPPNEPSGPLDATLPPVPVEGDFSEQDVTLAAALQATYDEDLEIDSPLDSACAAEGIVRVLGGADEMDVRYGVTPQTLADDEFLVVPLDHAYLIADTLFACGYIQLWRDSVVSDPRHSPAVAECIFEMLSLETTRTALALQYVDQAENAELASLNQASYVDDYQVALEICDN